MLGYIQHHLGTAHIYHTREPSWSLLHPTPRSLDSTLFPFPCGQSLDFGVHPSLMWLRRASWMVCTNHDDSILLASVWFEQDWAPLLAKEVWGLTLLRTPGKGDSHSSKGTCWGNCTSFCCCFLLCLDDAICRWDAWNCVNHPVTRRIPVLRTYLKH